MDFTKIENKILEKIITSHFTQREQKILLLIIRLSYGLNKNYAVIDKKDFFYAGIFPYHVDEILKQLLIRRIINWNPEKEMFWINKNLNEWIDKNTKLDQY